MTEQTEPLFILDAHCDSLILRESLEDPMDLADNNPMYQSSFTKITSRFSICD